MFTSRAEYRLILREDNADMRLREKGKQVGLVSDDEYKLFTEKRDSIETELVRIRNTRLKPSTELNALLKAQNTSEITDEVLIDQLLKRPELEYRHIAGISPPEKPLEPAAAEEVEIQVKYEGYIQRQLNQVERFAALEEKQIPPDMDYDGVTGLGTEVRQKLKTVRPVSLGQASRISGVTPAAISLLMVALEKRKRAATGTTNK